MASEIKARKGKFRMVQNPTKIGSTKSDFDSALTMQMALEEEEEHKEGSIDDGQEEDNDEGMGDLDDAGPAVINDDDDTTASE